jgi:hypothetical protein
MHKASVYCHFFFVPNRILWNNWETFIAGSVDGQFPNSDPADPAYSEPAFPKMDISAAQSEAGSLPDYIGLPQQYSGAGAATLPINDVSALPFAGYQKIYNDYFRDENLIVPDEVTLANGTQSVGDTVKLVKLQKRAWQHDYYTSALPWTQKGPEATLPLGTTAPITYQSGSFTYFKDILGNKIDGATFDAAAALKTDTGADAGILQAALPGNTNLNIDNSDSLSANLAGATAASINELRRAFRLQEWLERNARGGTRYIEIIMAHFGVQSSDARLQRPEFLGGSSTPITISEVLQTSDNSGGADGGPGS